MSLNRRRLILLFVFSFGLLALSTAGLTHVSLFGLAVATAPDTTAGGASPAKGDTRMQLIQQYTQWIEEEQEWIAWTQLPQGPFPTGRRVVPYFANFATFGLLVDEGDGPAYGAAVRRHLEWYLAHLERPDYLGIRGTVYDYELSWDGVLRPTGDYDSSDSYGATFFSALRRYYEITGDREFVQKHRAELEEIAGAVLATQQRDGLTWAKPNYRVKYLMDNSEVYRGLADLAFLCREVLGDAALADRYQAKADQVRRGIERYLWKGDHYAMAIDDRGQAFPWDGKKWYPDATSQLFPIWLGVIDPQSDRARQVYQRFNQEQPGWVRLEKDDPFPWATMGYAAAVMGDYDRADQYVRAVRAHYVEAGRRSWPWHPSEASFYVLTLAELRQAVASGQWPGGGPSPAASRP
ncbi:MAG TPA: hypothetical protein GXX55_11425 [Firmicutes bacterium]|nr:hypothetical protein [Bacillota bacterium]